MKDFKKQKFNGLLYFSAPWCAPCKIMSPIVDELSNELENVKVAKVNVDEAPEISGKLNIRSIPTFIVMKDGEIVDRKTGSMSKSKLVEMTKI